MSFHYVSPVQGEFVATGSARAATESRRNAFAALYQNLPPNLEEGPRGEAVFL